MIKDVACRFCGGPLAEIGLCMLRLCKSYLKKGRARDDRAVLSSLGGNCLLVEDQEYLAPEHIFRLRRLPRQARFRADLAVELEDEITAQLVYIRRWDTGLVVPIPELSVV